MSGKGKEVTKKQESEVSTEVMADWGGSPEVSAQDIVIPKILPMQGLSKQVTERKAQIGEFRDSVNGTLLGSIDEPLEFIPLHVEKIWLNTTRKNGENKFEFDGFEPITRANENRQWEEKHDNGDVTRHDYTWQVYVLLAKEVEEGLAMPYIISFRRTSARAGKKLMTQMYVKNKMAKKPPAAKVMTLSGSMESNSQGSYVVLDVTPARDTTNEELTEAYQMFKTIQSGKAKVDHSDVGQDNKTYVKDNVEF